MALSGGFLLALYFLSQWLQLETVNWVIRNLAAYVVFAIIVLFQSDIRRALAHFGRAPFFRYFERAEQADETIEELVVAATHAVCAPHRRDHRARAADRASQLHRGRHSARRDVHLRSAREHLPARLAAARRRRHRPGRSHCGGRLLPAAVGESARQPRSRNAAPRGARPHRRERRDCRSSCPRRRARSPSRWAAISSATCPPRGCGRG